MLGIEGSKYLVNLWAGDAPLDHYKLSPMYGDLEDLGYYYNNGYERNIVSRCC